MHLILGIHCPNWTTKQVAQMIQRSLARDPNTYFLYLRYLDSQRSLKLPSLKRLLPEHKDKLIEITFDPKRSLDFTTFDGYEKSFAETIAKLKEKLKAREKVKSTGIGAYADACFGSINGRAQQSVRAHFGSRTKTQSTYVPLVAGFGYPLKLMIKRLERSRGAAKLRKEVLGAKAAKRFEQIRKLK